MSRPRAVGLFGKYQFESNWPRRWRMCGCQHQCVVNSDAQISRLQSKEQWDLFSGRDQTANSEWKLLVRQEANGAGLGVPASFAFSLPTKVFTSMQSRPKFIVHMIDACELHPCNQYKESFAQELFSIPKLVLHIVLGHLNLGNMNDGSVTATAQVLKSCR